MLSQVHAKFGLEIKIGSGVYRNPRILRSIQYRAFGDGNTNYDSLVCQYTARRMSCAGDSLNACRAILQQLRESYFEGGFFWGLPVDSFPYALLWWHGNKPLRREGFPKWTWVGWEGALKMASLTGPGKLRDGERYREPPLRIWKCKGSSLISLHESYRDEFAPSRPNLIPGVLANKDPIYDAAMEARGRPEYPCYLLRTRLGCSPTNCKCGRKTTLSYYPNAQSLGYIFVEGMLGCLRFKEINESDSGQSSPTRTESDPGFQHILQISIGKAECLLDCHTERIVSDVRKRKDLNLRFLLMHREPSYELLLLDWDDTTETGGYANRGFVANTLAPVSLSVMDWSCRSYYQSLKDLVWNLGLRRELVILG